MNLANEIGSLAGVGARHFLVPNMPDLSITPFGRSLSPEDRDGLHHLSVGFDAGLAQAVAGLRATLGGSVNIVAFDTLAALDAVVANPAGYGLTYVDVPCFDGSEVCSDPSQYLFWDSVHPTARTHQILGDAFAAAVPEPGTHYLLALGLMLLALVWRQAAHRVPA
jgi:phospholipase/lecithinase/hemolysin